MGKNEIDVESMLAVLEEEVPLAKCSAYTYTRVVQEHFEKICLMKERRFSYTQIWKALKMLNLLPEYSNAHSFRQAFNREWKRRKGEESLESFLKANPKPITNFQEPGNANHNLKQCTPPELLKEKSDDTEAEALERERRKKLGFGRVVPTSGGNVIRTVDGGFEFD